MLKTIIEASVLKPARRNNFLSTFLEWATMFFFNDAPITVTVKTDSPNPHKCEMFGEKL